MCEACDAAGNGPIAFEAALAQALDLASPVREIETVALEDATGGRLLELVGQRLDVDLGDGWEHRKWRTPTAEGAASRREGRLRRGRVRWVGGAGGGV